VSVVTISAIKADICGCVGQFAAHQELIAEARRRRVNDAVTHDLLIDARATRLVAERMQARPEPIGDPAPIATWR